MMTTKKKYSSFVKCDCWEDFVKLSREARIVVYNFRVEEDSFHVYAIKERVFIYKESFPFPLKTEITKNGSGWKFQNHTTSDKKQLENTSDLVIVSRQPLQKKFECGIPYSVIPKLTRERGKWAIEFICEFSSETVAGFLSKILEVSKDRVIEGDVYSSHHGMMKKFLLETIR